MKSFAMWKMPILLAGLGAVWLFSPIARAQSEVAPDHFDGTDSWETAYRGQAVKSNKMQHKAGLVRVQASDRAAITTMQSSKATSPATRRVKDTVAVADNRKPAILKKRAGTSQKDRAFF